MNKLWLMPEFMIYCAKRQRNDKETKKKSKQKKRRFLRNESPAFSEKTNFPPNKVVWSFTPFSIQDKNGELASCLLFAFLSFLLLSYFAGKWTWEGHCAFNVVVFNGVCFLVSVPCFFLFFDYCTNKNTWNNVICLFVSNFILLLPPCSNPTIFPLVVFCCIQT